MVNEASRALGRVRTELSCEKNNPIAKQYKRNVNTLLVTRMPH